MSSIRKQAENQFSRKVYPNPSDPEVAKKLDAGIKEFNKNYLRRNFPWILNGIKHDRLDVFITVDPNAPKTEPYEHIIGMFPKFSQQELDDLVKNNIETIHSAGLKFFEKNPWQKRVELLKTISEVVKERFWLLCAAKMYETGQSVAEAIGETDEEVDFPLANAMYLEELNRDLLIPSPTFAGDISGKRFVPHMVQFQCDPFNFPGAIAMDAFTKALAMGNAVIQKPSPKAALCGYLVFESIKIAFERMGINWKGVINYAPGGKDVVDAFLSSPYVSGLSFTGSSAVLREIKKEHRDLLRYGYHGRAELTYGSAETSGVNIVVVWKDADPVHAAQECAKSFIGRSGQKCSSARIIFVHHDIYDKFFMALREYLEKVHYGDVKKGADLGAMITPADKEKLVGQIKELEDARLVRKLYEKEIDYVSASDFPPTVLRYTGSMHIRYEARTIMNTEFFGPVTTLVDFSELREVERMCKLSDFALTGSGFCRDLETFEWIQRSIPAGNLYWNRKCTGALVETECFGGLRSASSPSGIKGKNSLTFFGSQQTFSGFYPKGATEEEKRAYIEILIRKGWNLSKY